MYPVSPQAYDRAITVFSPDGRLFQVEYAKEAVKRGATGLGLVTKDGVIMAAIKNIPSRLVDSSSVRKVYEIDEHIYFSASGLIADARRIMDIGRELAKRHRATYNEEPPLSAVVYGVADIMQLYTQYGGARPFGVSILAAGFNFGHPYLYEIEPSGAVTGYFANSIGEFKKEVDAYLEQHYKRDMKTDEGIKLAVSAILEFEEDKNIERVELAVIRKVKNELEAQLYERDSLKKLLKKVGWR